jgi:hypothetical protein
MSNNADGVYTSKIIKAGALLPETRTLLALWDGTLSVAENLKRSRRENIFGKTSRSWVNQFVAIFQQRYLTDETITQALVTLAKHSFPAESLDRILYFHAAQSDSLLHDTVTEVLLPLRLQGRTEIFPTDIQSAIMRWMAEGKTTSQWSENTVTRATRNLIATLRDFGVLQGAAKKRLAPIYLPVEAFAYIAMALRRDQPSGERLLQHPEWRLFFLSPGAVERFFVEAHQRHLLEYHAAGSVIRITVPAQSIEEYAHVILQRAP